MRKDQALTEHDPDGFVRYWASYPKKEAKKDAYKAWCQLRPSADVQQQIHDALSWQREQVEWTKSGGCFVPLPASYLRGERWTDERRSGTDRRVPKVGQRFIVPTHEPL